MSDIHENLKKKSKSEPVTIHREEERKGVVDIYECGLRFLNEESEEKLKKSEGWMGWMERYEKILGR